VVDVLVEAYLEALSSMRDRPPRPLVKRATMMAEDLDPETDVGAQSLLKYLRAVGDDDSLMRSLGLALYDWDAYPDGDEWTVGTSPHAQARRMRIYDALALPESIAEFLDERLPRTAKSVIISSEAVAPWYPPPWLRSTAFYWDRYRQYLINVKRWNPAAVSSLDEDTRRVLERINDPTRPEKYSSRGLVVGYVQSGKTANFAGVIAKGIDAGYRLVIVLAGTLNILREQTQRRLDMELVGRENILRGRTEDDPDLEPHDYSVDQDWIAGKFVRLGFGSNRVATPRVPQTSLITTRVWRP
jgi:hypothetical protein